jgi:hypothetical protein
MTRNISTVLRSMCQSATQHSVQSVLSPSYKQAQRSTLSTPRVIPTDSKQIKKIVYLTANYPTLTIINDQQCAQNYATTSLYSLAPTCFGSCLSSSGGLLDPSELLEIQIECVVYHIMCGYVACVPNCLGSVWWFRR